MSTIDKGIKDMLGGRSSDARRWMETELRLRGNDYRWKGKLSSDKLLKKADERLKLSENGMIPEDIQLLAEDLCFEA